MTTKELKDVYGIETRNEKGIETFLNFNYGELPDVEKIPEQLVLVEVFAPSQQTTGWFRFISKDEESRKEGIEIICKELDWTLENTWRPNRHN